MKRSAGAPVTQLHGTENGPGVVRGRTAGWSRGLAVALMAGLVAACSAAATPAVQGATGTLPAMSTPTAVPTPTPPPTPTPTATPKPVSTPTPTIQPKASSEATGIPTSIDPCQLIPSQEASSLAGATYGAGTEGTTSGHGRTCVYGSQTLNVFNVIVGVAPDVATAQAGKAAAEAELQKAAAKGIKFTELPAFADGAAYFTGSVTISGHQLNAAAIYVLKGTVFFGFSDLALGSSVPNAAALKAEAQTILGRLP